MAVILSRPHVLLQHGKYIMTRLARKSTNNEIGTLGVYWVISKHKQVTIPYQKNMYISVRPWIYSSTIVRFELHVSTKWYRNTAKVYVPHPKNAIYFYMFMYSHFTDHTTDINYSFVYKTGYLHIDPYWKHDDTVKPVYNDHLMGYFSAFWNSSRWPRAT